ncbi:MAG: hypothetical protein IJR85_07655 [Synergistaceae bacterium]|nr:hypothetical protein [Synergistaceae bacterium]
MTTATFTGSGSANHPVFAGQFDGQNHTVKVNIQSNPDDYAFAVGTFFHVRGTSTVIRNLNVTGNVSGSNVVGGIVEELQAGVIENCTFTGTVESVRTTEDSYSVSAGGIAGHAGSFYGESAVRNCTFSGTVRGTGIIQGTAGGIVGANHSGKHRELHRAFRVDSRGLTRCRRYSWGCWY